MDAASHQRSRTQTIGNLRNFTRVTDRENAGPEGGGGFNPRNERAGTTRALAPADASLSLAQNLLQPRPLSLKL